MTEQNETNPLPENTPEQQPTPQGSPQAPAQPASPYEPTQPQQPNYNPYQQVPPHQPGYDQTPPQGYYPPQGTPVGNPQQAYTQQVPPTPGYQVPPHQAAPGYTPGYQQSDPYGYQQQGQQGYYPPYQQSPYYSGQPGYQEPPKKAKVWPWVLALCLIVGVLGIGGCVSCTAYLASQSTPRGYDYYDDFYDRYDDYGYDYDYDYDYDFSNPYGDTYGDEGNSDSYDGFSTISTYTLEDIKALASGMKSEVTDGVCTTGVFEVGKGKDISAGLYYLEGTQTTEGSFAVFEKNASGDKYSVESSVVYYGNYFAELEEGDVIVFMTPADSHMYPAEKAKIETGDTILSGCYRVGIDIPAGTYEVTYNKDANDTSSSQEAGVYVMKDLEWDDDSITESYGLMVGSHHTITVTEGQYLELYHGSMTPKAA